MEPAIETIGLVAGSRSLPLIFAREARAKGIRRIVAVAAEGETDREIERLADEVVWLRVGQLGRMIKAFTDRGVTHCVMLGLIAPRSLFDVRPDMRGISVLMRLKEKNAHTIFGAIADELEKDGVRVIPAVPWLESIMPGAGYRVGPALADREAADVSYGYRVAKEISRLEIGQCVVVKKGTVLAVEGFEGTDKCLTRGGELAGRDRGAVAVKVAKRNHDLRFDIPCIGPTTLEVCAAHGIEVLAVEAGMTLLLDKEDLERLAAQVRVTVVATGGEEALI
ncbi:MAG: UDP-2,3-diacylglucosamine diphosphatase LpxI [Verrucomicrobiae bacterium]|nr:UDP-2,3-diacylglucosamine diphosphatase LpxI [Verrucomicrobiae bacterium]